MSLEPVKAVLINCLNLFSLNLASCRALPRGMKRHYDGIELVELRSQYEDKPRKPKTEEYHPADSQNEEEAAAGSSAYVGTQNDAKSEHEPDLVPDLHIKEPDVDKEQPDVNIKEESDDDPDTGLDLESDPEQDKTHHDYDYDDEVVDPRQDSFSKDFGNDLATDRNTKSEFKEVDSFSEPNSPSMGYGESDRPKTDSFLPEDPIHQTQPSEPPHMLDDEVMTPEDLQMVAEALANTPDADRIAAAAEAEAGMTPTGRSTPIAASSTPHSGTYSEAGTPGPSGTLSEAGTPGPAGTFSEAGTPAPSGTESGTPGTPGTATTSGTTPQQGADGDGELLALAQDVKYSLDNHLNFSFSELDCGASLQ